MGRRYLCACVYENIIGTNGFTIQEGYGSFLIRNCKLSNVAGHMSARDTSIGVTMLFDNCEIESTASNYFVYGMAGATVTFNNCKVAAASIKPLLNTQAASVTFTNCRIKNIHIKSIYNRIKNITCKHSTFIGDGATEFFDSSVTAVTIENNIFQNFASFSHVGNDKEIIYKI